MLPFIHVALAVAGLGGLAEAVWSLVTPTAPGAAPGFITATLGFGLLGVLLKLDAIESRQANMTAAAVQEPL